jgi:pSer/pThr/pTyr-binding forkhead associated (FHA) protein
MPQLHVSLPDSGGTTHDLTDAQITIGRISENLLQIEDISVSSRHAQLTLDDGGDYVLRDLGSTNGTELNGKPIEPETDHKLQDGDKVRFGKIDTRYKSENPAEARPLPEAEEVAAVVAETSTRPADFANASPFQTKKVKKDSKGMALIALAVIAMAAFGYALFTIYSLQPPTLPPP